ncbi:hypothetical protein SAY86_018956 [Trapa natans]|uniref:Cytochrome b5 heme-binding domain-containing protein n=1 Tax=Trapa natans TaxID=22666 RepID=A0AAN7LB85_TRANT|nr:hypothetical protein SAY86_018956 [Trapa natans]
MVEKTKVFTLAQVAQHKFKKDCWLIINGRVLNVTSFLVEHPGGDEILLESAGKDASKEFEDIGHSTTAKNLLLKYQIGVLEGFHVQEPTGANADTKLSSKGPPQRKEMTAFVIKDKPSIKYGCLFEFFVPLLVASSYFAYRYVTVISKVDY